MGTKNLNITITEEMHNDFKLYAHLKQTTMKEVMIEKIQESINEMKRQYPTFNKIINDKMIGE